VLSSLKLEAEQLGASKPAYFYVLNKAVCRASTDVKRYLVLSQELTAVTVVRGGVSYMHNPSREEILSRTHACRPRHSYRHPNKNIVFPISDLGAPKLRLV